MIWFLFIFFLYFYFFSKRKVIWLCKNGNISCKRDYYKKYVLVIYPVITLKKISQETWDFQIGSFNFISVRLVILITVLTIFRVPGLFQLAGHIRNLYLRILRAVCTSRLFFYHSYKYNIILLHLSILWFSFVLIKNYHKTFCNY